MKAYKVFQKISFPKRLTSIQQDFKDWIVVPRLWIRSLSGNLDLYEKTERQGFLRFENYHQTGRHS